MSNEIVDGILRHYSKRHIQVRKDFFDICAYDKAQFNDKVSRNNKRVRDEPNQECMAKILRIIESLADNKKQDWYLNAVHASKQGLTVPKEPKEYRVTLSYSVICELLYNTYGESTVRKSVAELIHRNFLICYQAKKNSVPDYVINVPVVQAALKKLAEDSMLMPETEVSNLTPDPIEGDEGFFEVSNLTAEMSNVTPDVSNLTGKSSNLTPNNIRNKDVYTKEEENNTAQSPIGSVLNVSSSSPIHTQEDEPTPPTGLQQKLENFTPKRNNPRPSASPKEEKNTPPQSKQATKQSIDPDKLEQAKATIQREIGGRMIWESRDVSSVKKMLEQGATCEEIGIVIRGIKADPFQRKNLTVSYISRQFGNQLSQASLSIPADPSTQEDKHSRYDDPNFDPRMLSNTESIEYKSWLAAHEPIKP